VEFSRALTVLGLLALAVSVPGCRPSEPAIPAVPPPGADAGETLNLSLATVIRDYADNEVRADSRYKGRRLSVSGIVERVAHDATETAYVMLMVDGFTIYREAIATDGSDAEFNRRRAQATHADGPLYLLLARLAPAVLAQLQRAGSDEEGLAALWRGLNKLEHAGDRHQLALAAFGPRGGPIVASIVEDAVSGVSDVEAQAFFVPTQNRWVGSLHPRQSITVVCRCAGKSLNVILSECTPGKP